MSAEKVSKGAKSGRYLLSLKLYESAHLSLNPFEIGNRTEQRRREMRSEKPVTSFLNVDLDIRGNAGDVEDFLKSFENSVVVLSHTGQEASIELAKEYSSLEETALGLIEFVGALQPERKNIWERLDFRRLNVGIQAACTPHAAPFAISAKAVEMMAALRFEIVFTIYAPAKT
jgi:PHD/YefM family antitoxin component YafN of YafNO toxin-antitoxin module